MENFHLRQRLDTIVDPQNNHTIEDQGLLMDYPLEKLFGCCFLFLLGFKKASYIFGNWTCLRIPKEWNKRKQKQKKL